jgi:hypothetical protein
VFLEFLEGFFHSGTAAGGLEDFFDKKATGTV